MHIKGKLTTLRAPEPADVDLLHRWSNDPELWTMLGGWHFPYSRASTEQWVAQRADGNASKQVWCIETQADGIVGTGSLEAIDMKNRGAMLGMFIGNPAIRGKGYAVDATHAILRFAFDELGLQRIEGHVLSYNARSLATYMGKIGFIQEGVRRQACFKGGRFHDMAVLGLTRDDYATIRDAYWGTRQA